MSKLKQRLIQVLGGYFLLLGVLAFINTGIQRQLAFTLWFCYVGVTLIGLGMLWKSSNFVLAQLNILTIPLIIWNIDFCYILFTGNELFGITNYFFQGQFILAKFVTLQHLYTIPLGFFALWLLKEKPDKKSRIYAIIEVFAIFVLAILFTSVDKNVNCIYQSCIQQISIPFLWYQVIWLGAYVFIIFLTDWVIKKFY